MQLAEGSGDRHGAAWPHARLHLVSLLVPRIRAGPRRRGVSHPAHTAVRNRRIARFDAFLADGGYPEVLAFDERTRVKTLQSCREVAGLAAAMTRFGLRQGTLVTHRDEGELRTAGGPVRIVPAWKWCLDATEDAPGAGRALASGAGQE